MVRGKDEEGLFAEINNPKYGKYRNQTIYHIFYLSGADAKD